MQKHVDNVQNFAGDAVSGVTVTIRDTATQLLRTLFSDNGVTPLANPFTNDSDGEFFFFTVNGLVDIILSGPVTETRADIRVFDFADDLGESVRLLGTAAGPTAITPGQIILADVTSNAVALTLPLDQGAGFNFKDIIVSHVAGDVRANPITVERNSELINGVAADFVITQPFQRVRFSWAGDAIGWTAQDITADVLTDVRTAALVLPDASLIAALSVDVQPDALYDLEATLLVTSPAADDFQFDFTTPAADAIDGIAEDVVNGLVLFSEAAAVVILTAGTLEVVRLKAVVVMASTVGTITLRAAKNADTGADGSLGIGSFMKLRRLDE